MLNDVRLLFVQAGVFRSDPVMLQLNPCPQVGMLRLDPLHGPGVCWRAGWRGEGWLGVPGGDLVKEQRMRGLGTLHRSSVDGPVHRVDRDLFCATDNLETALLGSLIFHL